MITIFPGHSGKDSGAIQNNTVEASITASIAKTTYEMVRACGIDCAYVDGSFDDRIKHSLGSSLGVEVHCDSFSDKTKVGFHCIYHPSGVGKMVAEVITDSLMEVGVRPSRNPDPRTDLFILNKTKFPVILVETGFLSNKEECERLRLPSYQNLIALGIAHGILSVSK